MNERFEWNKDKAARNWRDHRVSFEQATKAFRDPFRVEAIDDREGYGEERVNLLGMCNGVILHLTYTERDDVIGLSQPDGQNVMNRYLLPREFELTALWSRYWTTAANGLFQKGLCSQ